MNGAVQDVITSNKVLATRQTLYNRTPGNRFRATAVSHLSLELSPLLASSIFDRSGQLNDNVPSTSGRSAADTSYVQFPSRQAREPTANQKNPTVRVKLNVHYRVHSRQMLCIGGSQLPFGWSFLSIANVPLAWNPGDVWSTEVSFFEVLIPVLHDPA